MEHCYEPGHLPDPSDLPADDPRRRHLETCPRCRGRVAARELFLTPGDTGDLEGLAAADAELARRLEAALARPTQAAGVSSRRRFWYALAAILALGTVGLTVSEIQRLREGSLPRVGERLRGDEPATQVEVTAGEQGLRLSWAAAPPAETYLFRFLGADLADVGQRVASRSSLALAVSDLPAGGVFCQVFALSHGDTLARSAIVRIQPQRE